MVSFTGLFPPATFKWSSSYWLRQVDLHFLSLWANVFKNKLNNFEYCIYHVLEPVFGLEALLSEFVVGGTRQCSKHQFLVRQDIFDFQIVSISGLGGVCRKRTVQIKTCPMPWPSGRSRYQRSSLGQAFSSARWGYSQLLEGVGWNCGAESPKKFIGRWNRNEGSLRFVARAWLQLRVCYSSWAW